MASARLRQPAASSAIAAFTAGAESSAAARSKRVAASLSSAAERGPASQGSVSHPAQHHSPHLVGCRIVRHRPHNPRGQRLELLVVPPLRLGQLGAHLPCQVGEGIPFAVDACVFSTRNLSIYRSIYQKSIDRSERRLVRRPSLFPAALFCEQRRRGGPVCL